MRCPKCSCLDYDLAKPCPTCGFSADSKTLESLSQRRFLLTELDKWKQITKSQQKEISTPYLHEITQIEITLGLRPPPLDVASAQNMSLELEVIQASIPYVSDWQKLGVISKNTAVELRSLMYEKIHQISIYIYGKPKTTFNRQAVEAAQMEYLAARLKEFHEKGQVSDQLAWEATYNCFEDAIQHHRFVSTKIQAQTAALPVAKSQEQVITPTPSALKGQIAAKLPSPPKPPKPARPPLTWDQVWKSLLSESTLRAILFLGAGLLFAAMVSLVVWNWDAFPPAFQLVFLALFTGIFFALGWFVRTRMKLTNPGIALTAVAMLVIPLDFYAIYLSGGFPKTFWPLLWLAGSLVCLAVYLLVILINPVQLFGYLVPLAAGSLSMAICKLLRVDPIVWPAILVVLAFLLALAGEALLRRTHLHDLPQSVQKGPVEATPDGGKEGSHPRVAARLALLGWPLWHTALLAAAVIVLLTTGRNGFSPQSSLAQVALAISWLLTGALFALGRPRFRLDSFTWLAAISFPLGVVFTQQVIYTPLNLSTGWYASGLAVLSGGYFLWSWRSTAMAQQKGLVKSSDGRILAGFGWFLVILAGGLALLASKPMAVVHLMLACVVAGSVVMFRKPWLSLVTSLFLLSGVTGLAAVLGKSTSSLAQLGLVWNLLAILLMIAGIQVKNHLSQPVTRRDYATPVFLAAWVISSLALLLPLVSFTRITITFLLGSWLVINVWLALLVDELHRMEKQAGVLQWCTALIFPFWLWLWWTGSWPENTWLGMVIVAAGFAPLVLSAILRNKKPIYTLPWQVSTHLCALAGLGLALRHLDWSTQIIVAGVAGLVSILYFAMAGVWKQRLFTGVGGIAFFAGWILLLNRLGMVTEGYLLASAGATALMMASAAIVERKWKVTRSFFAPLNIVAQAVAVSGLAVGLMQIIRDNFSDFSLAWAAAGLFLLVIVAAWYAWHTTSEIYTHLTAWLGVAMGACLTILIAKSSGSSAIYAALFASVYILGERIFWRFAVRKGIPEGRSEQVSVLQRIWRLYRRAILIAGWAITGITVFIALVVNLAILGGGKTVETWSILGLLVVVCLYALSATLFHEGNASQILTWLTALLLFVPWTLLTHLGWYVLPRPTVPAFAIAWLPLAILEYGAAISLARLRDANQVKWSLAPRSVAYGLAPLALLWGVADAYTSSFTYGLGILFYLLVAWEEVQTVRRNQLETIHGRALYPATLLTPVWVVVLLHQFVPNAPQEAYAAILMGFILPGLSLGLWFRKRQPAYRWPFYLAGYVSLLVGTTLAATARPWLIGALLLDTAVAIISSWIFRQPTWIYLASATFPASVSLALIEWHVPSNRHGWVLLGVAALYLGIAWLSENYKGLFAHRVHLAGEPYNQEGQNRAILYSRPLIASAFALIALALPSCSLDPMGALVGYAVAALLYAVCAFWLIQPVLLFPAAGLSAIAYWMVMVNLNFQRSSFWLVMWIFIALTAGIGYGLDRFKGVIPDQQGGTVDSFPWYQRKNWLNAILERMLRWWSFPLYCVAFLCAVLSPLLSYLYYPELYTQLAIILTLSALFFGLATWFYRLRGWLLVSTTLAQLSIWMWIYHLCMNWYFLQGGLTNGSFTLLSISQRVLLFTPFIWLTAIVGLRLAKLRAEGTPFATAEPERFRAIWNGWSRPLYLLVLVDILLGQIAVIRLGPGSPWVTLSNGLLLALLASSWASRWLAVLPPLLGFWCLQQGLSLVRDSYYTWPWAVALLAFGYGLVAYGLISLQRKWPENGTIGLLAHTWRQALRIFAWFFMILALVSSLFRNFDVVSLVFAVIFGPQKYITGNLAGIQSAVLTLAISGLFFLLVSAVEYRRWLGYIGVASLLISWSLEWLLVWNMREVQWYAIPAGLYLLGMGYLERRNGDKAGKSLARWADRLAMLLMIGSVFLQSRGDRGWVYALLMGAEGLLMVLWGSACRLRRFLYAGVFAIVLDVVGQLIDPLLSANRWIVFGAAGVILLALGTFLQQRRDRIVAISAEMRNRLEDWE